MSRDSIYLDCNATAPVRPEVVDAVTRALVQGGNPSSIHASGRAARAVIEEAREQVAALVGASASEVIFTSGGTEANALAIGSAIAAGARRLIVGATEHESVVETAKRAGLPVAVWPVDARGVADLAWLRTELAASPERPFVALMLANNETGVIQPVAEAAALVHGAGGILHADAIQGAGKIPVDIKALGVDTLSLSAHKLGGPSGVGALVFAPGAAIHRQLHGGGQERGLRSGTENLSGIAGFGAAAAAAARDLDAFMAQAAWRDETAERIKAAAKEGGGRVQVAGEGALRLPNTLCLAVTDYPSNLQVMALDLDGVMVSAGSACSSGKVRQSAVLATMGLGEAAQGSLRVSGGWNTTEADWRRFADVWIAAHERHVARIRAKELA